MDRIDRNRVVIARLNARDCRRQARGLIVLAVLALTACTGPGESPSTSRPPAPTTTQASRATPAPTGIVDEDTGEIISQHAVPTWDMPSRTAAVKAARNAMAAFARPRLDQETWWTELSPLLTPQAQLDYAYVDPANVPVAAVTGPGTLMDETSAYVTSVEVPTDVGTYTLVVTRADADAPWLTSRITPPAGTR